MDVTNHGLYRSAFACEKEKWKAEFISKFVHSSCLEEFEPACVFQDIMDLASRTAPCYTHDRHCRVPGKGTGHNVVLAIAGFSCKDLSKLGAAYSQNKTCLRKQEGTSGQTLKGLLDYLAHHHVGAYLGENVDELEDYNSENRVYMDGVRADP